VQVGSGSNVDPDTSHAQIRTFNVSTAGVTLPIDWTRGPLKYNGVRNTVGFRYDKMGNLWSVDNGVDNLERKDLGIDIHNDFHTVGRKEYYQQVSLEALVVNGVILNILDNSQTIGVKHILNDPFSLFLLTLHH